MAEIGQSATDVSHLLTAFSALDRDKKQLESKVVELQVALASAGTKNSKSGSGTADGHDGDNVDQWKEE